MENKERNFSVVSLLATAGSLIAMVVGVNLAIADFAEIARISEMMEFLAEQLDEELSSILIKEFCFSAIMFLVVVLTLASTNVARWAVFKISGGLVATLVAILAIISAGLLSLVAIILFIGVAITAVEFLALFIKGVWACREWFMRDEYEFNLFALIPLTINVLVVMNLVIIPILSIGQLLRGKSSSASLTRLSTFGGG